MLSQILQELKLFRIHHYGSNILP